MNLAQYYNWRANALTSLSYVYTIEESYKVLDWFDRIKGEEEYELTGHVTQESLRSIRDQTMNFNLYNDLMMRVWLYAPFIIAEKY